MFTFFLDYSDVKEFLIRLQKRVRWDSSSQLSSSIIMQCNEQIYLPLPRCWFDCNKQPIFSGFTQYMWAKNLGGKQKYLSMCTSDCVPSTDKYLINLLGKETPVVKADPITTQQNTTPAEVDTRLLPEKLTNVVKYNLDKVNLKAMLVSAVFIAMLGWPNSFKNSRGTLWLVYAVNIFFYKSPSQQTFAWRTDILNHSEKHVCLFPVIADSPIDIRKSQLKREAQIVNNNQQRTVERIRGM